MASLILLDAEPCIDPVLALDGLASLTGDVPERAEAARRIQLATSYRCPLGEEPGIAYCLLTRKQIDGLHAPAATYPVRNLRYHTLSVDAGLPTKLIFKNLVYVDHKRVIHGKADDLNSLCLARFADPRWLLKNPAFAVTCNKRYNVPAMAWGPGHYHDDSTDADGDPWTWETMLEDLWDLMGEDLGTGSASILGAWPDLPTEPDTLIDYEPDGIPENWNFVGVSAYAALNMVLRRINCQLRYDPTKLLTQGAFTIVKVGNPDLTFTTAIRRLEVTHEIEDDEPKESLFAQAPYGVRVFFHVQPQYHGTQQTVTKDQFQWAGGQQVHSVDIDGPYTDYVPADIYHPIWDDMLAVRDFEGEITNEDALEDRAQERSDQFYEQLIGDGGAMMYRSYSGPQLLLPGSLCKGVAWLQDDDGGWVTQTVNHPLKMVKVEAWGEWTDASTGLQPPNLRPSMMPYPPNTVPVFIRDSAGETCGSGSSKPLYSGVIQHNNPLTCEVLSECVVWVTDRNGSKLSVGNAYMGLLNGYKTVGTGTNSTRPHVETFMPGLPVASSPTSTSTPETPYCSDIMVGWECISGSPRSTMKSLRSAFPFDLSNTLCSGEPSVCDEGYVDTSNTQPLDCMPEDVSFTINVPGCETYSNSFTLTWDEDDEQWVSIGVPPTWTLTYESPFYKLRSGDGNAVYILDGLLWNSTGSNTLTLQSGTGPCAWPGSVTLGVGAAGASQGSNGVESGGGDISAGAGQSEGGLGSP